MPSKPYCAGVIVWYDAAEEILWTLNPAEGMQRPEGLHIEVEDQERDLQPHRVVAGQLVSRDELTAALISRIRQLRGQVRARDITVLPGQDTARQDKERQGAAFLADPDPAPADYPAIMAEAGITRGQRLQGGAGLCEHGCALAAGHGCDHGRHLRRARRG